MRQPPTERQVVDWLMALAKVVPANPLVPDLAGSLREFTELLLLSERYDSRDFNLTSREFVARTCKFWPGYADLCAALDKWPKPAEKAATSQPSLDGEDLNDDDRMCIAWWNKRVAEGATKAQLDNLGSLIRAKSLRAWGHIQPTEESDKVTSASVTRNLAALRGHPMRKLMTGVLISMLLDRAPDLIHLVEDDALGEDGIGLASLRALYQERTNEAEDKPILREAAAYRLSRLPSALPKQRTEPSSFLTPPASFLDVTLKGDALRKSRAARGCNVPEPNPPPEPCPEPMDAMF